MKKIIAIVGPTGSGKTALGVKIAKEFNGEIINIDAFQVYKEISIGTNKINKNEMNGIKFHLNGEVSIYDSWDIKIFQDRTNEIIDSIISKKKLPILVGGSNLYLDALIYNYDLSAAPRDDKFENLSNEQIYKLLLKQNQEVALKLGVNNRRRNIRALQIINNKEPFRQKNKLHYDCFLITCFIERQKLYDKINTNVDLMIKNGWKNEIETLYQRDKNIDALNAFKAIGYSDILNSIVTNKNIDIEKIKQKTRQYAKRQLSWIRHHYHTSFIFNDNYHALEQNIADFIK